MFYERKIKYLDYLVKEERYGNAGFIKLEARDRICNITVQVNGLKATDSFSTKVVLVGAGQEKELCGLQLTQGKGTVKLTGESLENLGGTGISYENLMAVKIPISEERKICARLREPEETPAAAGDPTISEEVRPPENVRPLEKPGQTGGWEPPKEERPQDRAVSREEPGVSRVSESAWSLKEAEPQEGPEKTERPMQMEGPVQMEGPGQTERLMQMEGPGQTEEPEAGMSEKERPWERAWSLEEAEPQEESVQKKRPGQMEGPGLTEKPEAGFQEEFLPEENPGMSEEQSQTEALWASGETEAFHDLAETEDHDDQIPDMSVPVRWRQSDGEEGIISSQAERLDRLEQSSRPRQSVNAEQGGRSRQKNTARPQAFPLFEQKWRQLWAIYPHISPFKDGREYLSVGPNDFVILPDKYYRLANNSFLLHGYYNYKHLVLKKMEVNGQERYYIGVPGNFFDREKQVAVMFGFESFDCQEEPAQVGDYGYYLMRIEL